MRRRSRCRGGGKATEEGEAGRRAATNPADDPADPSAAAAADAGDDDAAISAAAAAAESDEQPDAAAVDAYGNILSRRHATDRSDAYSAAAAVTAVTDYAAAMGSAAADYSDARYGICSANHPIVDGQSNAAAAAGDLHCPRSRTGRAYEKYDGSRREAWRRDV